METLIDYYDDFAQEWAERWYENESLKPYLHKFLSYLPQNPNVLDLCCGCGYESMRLHNMGANVVGVDLSEKSIAIAKERNPKLRFYVRDMLKSYKDLGQFDGIACIAGIVHLQSNELEQAFINMHEVLKPDGYLLLVFKESGENRYCVVNNNVEYARNFIFHDRKELSEKMGNLFEFVKDISQEGDWKYFIYKRK